MTNAQQYLSIAERKRQERDGRIPPVWRLQATHKNVESVIHVPETCGLLTEREVDITSNNDAVDIVSKIRKRTLSAEETIRAFCKRAAIVHQLVSAK
jgi:amidase